MKSTAILALAALGVALSSPALGQVAEAEVEALSVRNLQRVYLACERGAVQGSLDSGSVVQCSIVYELLKQRAFQGDFEQLFAWSREELKRERTAGR